MATKTDRKPILSRNKKPSSNPANKPADLELIADCFRLCQLQDGSISTNHYLAGVNEIIKMYRQMGKGMSVTLHDAAKYIKELEMVRVTGVGGRPCDNLDIILHQELSLEIAERKDPPSATRCLIKVHRTIDFVLGFVRGLHESIKKDKPFSGPDRVNIYEDVMGKWYPVMSQAASKAILLQSPNRKEIIKNLTAPGLDVENPVDQITDILVVATPVQDKIRGLLSDYVGDKAIWKQPLGK